MSRLPSLRAMRAFQVTGKHLNLADAAEELCITASGVSHQIRLLEDDLGTKLFNRTGRGLELTERGAELLLVLSDIFDNLHNAISEFRENKKGGAVHIAMPVNFASRWFIPNLAKFEEMHPHVNIRLSSQDGSMTRPGRNDLDCAIRFGQTDWPGYSKIPLFSEKLVIVCSPRLLRLTKSISGSLQEFRFLQVETQPGEWEAWARGTGMDLPLHARKLIFESRELAIQGSIEGLGITLAGFSEIAEDIRVGRLVQVMEDRHVVNGTYYFLVSDERAALPGLRSLTEWVRSEFSERSSHLLAS